MQAPETITIDIDESVGVRKLQQRIGEWSAKTFPASTTYSTALHVAEEGQELVDATVIGNPDAMRDECADLVILAVQYANRAGFDLYEAIRSKFERVQARAWLPADANGVVRHARGGGE